MAKKDPVTAPDEAPIEGPKKSKKKLFIILGIVVTVLAVGASGFIFIQNKKAKENLAKQKVTGTKGSEDRQANDSGGKEEDPKIPPVFVQMDKFVFNLATAPVDKTGVGQIEMQIRVDDTAVSETMKNYMPIIRNNVLLLLTSKAYEDIATPEGKKILQEELMEAIRQPLPKRKDKGNDKSRGIRSVNFASFIMN